MSGSSVPMATRSKNTSDGHLRPSAPRPSAPGGGVRCPCWTVWMAFLPNRAEHGMQRVPLDSAFPPKGSWLSGGSFSSTQSGWFPFKGRTLSSWFLAVFDLHGTELGRMPPAAARRGSSETDRTDGQSGSGATGLLAADSHALGIHIPSQKERLGPPSPPSEKVRLDP